MSPSPSVPPSQLRVSDDERRHVAELLSRHFADGRLDQAELDERVGQAMAARTRADLAGLLVDLPPLDGEAVASTAPLPPPPALHRRRRLAGVLSVVLLAPAAASFLVHTLFWHNWLWPGGPGGGPFHPRLAPVLLVLLLVVVLRRVMRHRHRVRAS